jgi:hypothetical protein
MDEAETIKAAMAMLGRRSAAAARLLLSPEAISERMSELGRAGGRAGKGKPKRRKPKPS